MVVGTSTLRKRKKVCERRTAVSRAFELSLAVGCMFLIVFLLSRNLVGTDRIGVMLTFGSFIVRIIGWSFYFILTNSMNRLKPLSNATRATPLTTINCQAGAKKDPFAQDWGQPSVLVRNGSSSHQSRIDSDYRSCASSSDVEIPKIQKGTAAVLSFK